MAIPISKKIEVAKDLITRKSSEYAIFVSSGQPEILNHTGSLITSVLADSFVIAPQIPSLYLEAELIIGGIAISGESVQRRKFEIEPLNFRWTLSFDKTGVHEVQLIVRAVSVREG